jgi:hypothetical protein
MPEDHLAAETALARVRAYLARPTPSLRMSPADRGCVYFIQADTGGPIKIGTALDVPRRLKKLQQANAEKLTVLCVRKGGRVTERKYHDRFASHRQRGEWFAGHPDILAEIERLTVVSLGRLGSANETAGIQGFDLFHYRNTARTERES